MLSLRDSNGKLLAFSLAKESEDGIIGENTAYDLSESSKKRSLGTLMELKLISYGLENDIPYLYIGALNLGSNELGHKGRYNASEIYDRHTEQWMSIPRNPSPEDLEFNP